MTDLFPLIAAYGTILAIAIFGWALTGHAIRRGR